MSALGDKDSFKQHDKVDWPGQAKITLARTGDNRIKEAVLPTNALSMEAPIEEAIRSI